jgi:HK97 gp10 family phage protein
MALVTLKSRIPQITAEMEGKLNTVVRAGAENIERTAKELAPDAPPLGEGLVAAIHTEHDALGSSVVAGDDEVFYGHFIENGTVNTPPHPFLVPAVEVNHAPIVGAAARVLRGL